MDIFDLLFFPIDHQFFSDQNWIRSVWILIFEHTTSLLQVIPIHWNSQMLYEPLWQFLDFPRKHPTAYFLQKCIRSRKHCSRVSFPGYWQEAQGAIAAPWYRQTPKNFLLLVTHIHCSCLYYTWPNDCYYSCQRRPWSAEHRTESQAFLFLYQEDLFSHAEQKHTFLSYRSTNSTLNRRA